MKQSERQRIVLGVSYRGQHYCGWQRQKHRADTVQETLESALSSVANEPIQLVCAGRTDTGVHATGQVVHFDTGAIRQAYGWQMGVNTQLPKDIRIDWVRFVNSDFHARFSASYRRYQYVIADNSIGHAILDGLITPYRQGLDVDSMHVAAQHLLGERDFSSFRAAQCQSNTAFRHIDFIRVERRNGFVVIDIQANAFLYHMVRNIVGALLLVGCGKRSRDWLATLLAAKDRCQAPATAPADGLYLVEVGYNGDYALPKVTTALPFLITN